MLMEQLGLSQEIRDSVCQTFERWDGKGEPDGVRGEEVLLASRLVNLADVVVVFERADGVDAAIAVARARRGTQFDPGLVDLFVSEAEGLFAGLDGVSTWEAAMAAEPLLERELTNGELDSALGAVADFVDVKSPYTIGHSRVSPSWQWTRRQSPASPSVRSRTCTGRGCCTISVVWVSPTRSGTSTRR